MSFEFEQSDHLSSCTHSLFSFTYSIGGVDERIEVLEKEHERLVTEKKTDLERIAELEKHAAETAGSNGRIKLLQDMTAENNMLRTQNAALRSQLAQSAIQQPLAVEQENDANISAAMFLGNSSIRPLKLSVVATPHRSSRFGSSMMRTPPRSVAKPPKAPQ